jgi:anti-sigma factor RsiW
MTELSDELLVAYVDGQLARAQTRAVERVLEQDDVIARRVDALKQAHGRLESAFEAILAGEVSEVMAAQPMAPPPALRSRGNGLVKVGLATVGTGLALAALVAGYGWPLVVPDLLATPPSSPQQQQQAVAPPLAPQRPQQAVAAPPAPQQQQVAAAPPTWQEQAARAHALLSRATVEVGLESQGNQDLVAFQIAQAIGPAVKLPDLKAQGLKFVRAQLLRYGDKPLAQMLYLGVAKDPLALYAMRGGGGSSGPLFRQEGAIGSVSWREDGIAYLLAGEEEEAVLSRLVEKIRNEPSVPDMPPPPPPRLEPQLSQAPADPAISPSAAESPPTASDPLATGSTPAPQQASPEPAAGPQSGPAPTP